MILLDTDHLSVLKYPENRQCASLLARMNASRDEFVTSIVSAEEQFRGWLARISEVRKVHQQVRAYTEFLKLIQFFNGFRITSFDEAAADTVEVMRRQKIRIGTMDLKIEAIALANNVLLLSRNLRDFGRVPGLRVESWLIPPNMPAVAATRSRLDTG